jgi:transposase
MGHDGWRVLAAIDDAETPPWRREVPAVAILRRVWRQHDRWDGIQLQWREADNIPPAARFISSPDDAEAHDARKHTTPWVGSTGHITETCEEDLPHLITHIDTTPGPTADGAATPQIHAALEPRGLLPGTHMVDTGFLDADLLVDRRHDYGVDWLGPTRLDDHGHAREGAGVDVQPCQIDGDQHQASWPAGKTSISWTPALDNRGNAVITVKCSSTDCRRGDHGAQCVRSQKRAPRRTLTLRPQPPYQALQAARQREATEAFQAEEARRAGSAGTIARGVRGARLRRSRDVGRPRVPLGHLLTAAGLNVLRLGAWGLETARAKTRRSPCARLLANSAAASPETTSPAVSLLEGGVGLLPAAVGIGSRITPGEGGSTTAPVLCYIDPSGPIGGRGHPDAHPTSRRSDP